MKNIIYVLAILLGLNSCKKEEFNYQVYQPKVSDIDSVYFSTGSPSLIADNQATLQFVIQAFRKVSVENTEGKLVDSMMFVDYQALPASDVKVYADGQLFNGMEYKTNNTSKSSIKFYAQIGSVKSKEKTVQIRQPQAATPKRIVDVVFHVFELSTTDAAYDPLTYQNVELRHLQEAIEYANAVFNNTYGKDPNGGKANIEFRLATKNPAGATLAQPGFNSIPYNSTWKSSPTAANFTLTNFTDKINATAAYKWDKDKFLNIYILPFAGNSSIGNNRAAYQTVPTGETAIAGITNIVNSEADVPQDNFYLNYGLGIHRTMFFPGSGRKIEIASYLAVYYGIYPTYNGSATATTVVDYVNDTRKYLTGSNQKLNHVNNLLKTDLDGEKFLANNAMDELRFASLRNCFTLGQVERMRLVMERSPVRKAWIQE